MTQDSTGRSDDDPTAKFEHGSAPNTDPGPYGPAAYGQQYQYPQPGYQPDGYPPPGYPPPGYPQPPLGAYGAYPGYPPPARGTNTMAILALVFAFVFAPAGIVFGIIARNQIARTGEEGEGLALAGLIVGAVFTLLIVAYIIFMVAIFAAAFSTIPAQT
jgi:hypothetical protein